MTPTELETYVRQQYNAVGDSRFPQGLIFGYFYEAQVQLATEANCIRRVYETTSVEDQRVYDFPTNAFSLVRVEYNGERLTPNDFIDDDATTGNNANDSITGTPEFYQQWDQEIYLRPIPDTDGVTIKLYTYDLPSIPTAVGNLDVPDRYHIKLANYALGCMASADLNFPLADRYFKAWQTDKEQCIAVEKASKTQDRLRTVKDYNEITEPRFW